MLSGEPDAGNLHVRFVEGRVDRPFLLFKGSSTLLLYRLFVPATSDAWPGRLSHSPSYPGSLIGRWQDAVDRQTLPPPSTCPAVIMNARPPPVRGALHQAALHRVEANIPHFLAALLHRGVRLWRFAGDANSESPRCFRLGSSLQVTKKKQSEKRQATQAGHRRALKTSVPRKSHREFYKQDSALPSYFPETLVAPGQAWLIL